MNNKLALNRFNCGQTNFSQKAYGIKCKCLPKQDHNQYKQILRCIQTLKIVVK